VVFRTAQTVFLTLGIGLGIFLPDFRFSRNLPLTVT
jgi:hypothetical protein